MSSLQTLGLLVLRLALALIFSYHGYPSWCRRMRACTDFSCSTACLHILTVSGILECFGSLLLLVGLLRAHGLGSGRRDGNGDLESTRHGLVVKEYEFLLS